MRTYSVESTDRIDLERALWVGEFTTLDFATAEETAVRLVAKSAGIHHGRVRLVELDLVVCLWSWLASEDNPSRFEPQ